MNREYKAIRLQLLDAAVTSAADFARLARPSTGWVRAVREGLGLSLRAFASRLGMTAPSAQDLERNEARGAITLATLERAAAALHCRVVYALVPTQQGETFTELEKRISPDFRLIRDTEHSMRLEAQDVGGTEERAKRGIRRGK